jgi:hypothetical protein
MAEEVSESKVAAVNDEPPEQLNSGSQDTKIDQSFREYLDDKLRHNGGRKRGVRQRTGEILEYFPCTGY